MEPISTYTPGKSPRKVLGYCKYLEHVIVMWSPEEGDYKAGFYKFDSSFRKNVSHLITHWCVLPDPSEDTFTAGPGMVEVEKHLKAQLKEITDEHVKRLTGIDIP